MSVCAQHLHEQHLLACYLAEREGSAPSRRITAHLAECRECAGRYAAYAELLDATREAGDAEADAHFTPDRLHVQQLQIAHRLEHVGRTARVLVFPKRLTGRRTSPVGPAIATRWVAAAAAAGLFVGAAVGVFSVQSRLARTRTAVAAMHVTPAVAQTPVVAAQKPAPDDAFLSELELDLGSPGTPELQPFDALTPRVVEVANKGR